MARQPRLTLAGEPHHVVLRGNDRQAIVRDDTDREHLQQAIFQQARNQRVALHAWVIVDNHFHLLITPDTADGVPKMMQALGRSHVRHFNDRHRRSGTLWEGRYRSTLVQPDGHLLDCMVYLDLHPVRLGLAADPAGYPWSSHAHYAGTLTHRQVTPPAAYWALGNTPFAREAAYVAAVRTGLGADRERHLVDAALHGWAWGDEVHLAELQRRTGRRLSRGQPGRPRREAPDADPLNPSPIKKA